MKFLCASLVYACAVAAIPAPVRGAAESGPLVTQDVRQALSRATLLLRAGKKDEAWAAVKGLFPQGPPDGPLALEYYRIIGSSPSGWALAKEGLERLAKAFPDNADYRSALATLLAARPEVQRPRDAPVSPKRTPARAPDQRLLQHGLALLDEGNAGEASPLFSQLMERMPANPQVVGGLGLVRLREGRHGDARSLFEKALRLDPDNASKWQSLVRTASYWGLLQEARLAREAKDTGLAEQKVRAALRLDPSNGEGVAVLAGVQDDRGDLGQAEKLYRDALALEPSNGSAIRGLTALLARQGRRLEAMALLDSQGADARAINGKYTYLRVGILRDEAEDLIRKGQKQQAQTILEEALALEPESPWTRYDLATLLQGSASAKARGVMTEGVQIAPRGVQMLYAGALYFAKVDEPDEALRLLARIASEERSAPMLRLLQRMKVQSAVLRAQAFDKGGSIQAADAELEAAALEAGDDPDLLFSVANAWMARNRTEPALDLMRAAVARQPKPPVALRMRFVSLLNRARQDAELRLALDQLAEFELSADDRIELERLQLQLSLRTAYAHLTSGKVAEAQEIAIRLGAAYPGDSRVTILAGNIARRQGRYDTAMILFRHAKSQELAGVPPPVAPTDADNEIASMMRRREGRAIVGFNSLSKPGTPGVSDVSMTEIPVEVQLPLGFEGHVFVHVDTTDIKVGTLDLTDGYTVTRYGKVKALAPDGLPVAAAMQAKGTAFALGYETDDWRFDLGTTPQGFPVQDFVGGVKWSGSCLRLACSVEFSRRPVTGSLLAYAGTADPVSGEVWGGVRSVGVDLRLRHEWGTATATLGLGHHQLHGRNVLTNTQSEVRPEISWTLLRTDDMRLSGGLAYTYWAYREDLSYYTFGHGGYYSPQSYHSISIPWRWSGRTGSVSYALTGSVSASRSENKDMPYYPTRPDLQALAGNPVHAGGNGYGTGYTLGAVVEKKIAPFLYVGGRVEIGRAPYYMPNAASVYLRYQFESANDAMPLSPTPARTHAQY